MIALLERGCARHRSVLLDSIEGRWDEASPAALAHLDRCRRCERELSLTALTLAGLRRLAAEAREAEPSPDGWMLIRGRIQRPAPARWPAAFGLGKAVVSVGVLVTLIAPVWVAAPVQPLADESLAPATTRPARQQTKAKPSPRVVLTTRQDAPRYEKGPNRLNPTLTSAPKTTTTAGRGVPTSRTNHWWTK